MEQKNEPEDISIEGGKNPKCPSCGNDQWIVLEKITRESKLVRVDNLRDLVVEKYDLGNYQQALKIECESCGAEYFPQAEIKSHEELNTKEQVEAYSESLYEWPSGVTNEVQY